MGNKRHTRTYWKGHGDNPIQDQTFLWNRGSPSNDTDIKAFLDRRPDGVAFDETSDHKESLSPRIQEGDGH